MSVCLDWFFQTIQFFLNSNLKANNQKTWRIFLAFNFLTLAAFYSTVADYDPVFKSRVKKKVPEPENVSGVNFVSFVHLKTCLFFSFFHFSSVGDASKIIRGPRCGGSERCPFFFCFCLSSCGCVSFFQHNLHSLSVWFPPVFKGALLIMLLACFLHTSWLCLNSDKGGGSLSVYTDKLCPSARFRLLLPQFAVRINRLV